MDCAAIVLGTPIVCMTAALGGYLIGRFRYQYEVQELTEYNDKLSDIIDVTKEKLSASNNRLAAISYMLDKNNDKE
jgi:hypothetical protein